MCQISFNVFHSDRQTRIYNTRYVQVKTPINGDYPVNPTVNDVEVYSFNPEDLVAKYPVAPTAGTRYWFTANERVVDLIAYTIPLAKQTKKIGRIKNR